MGKPTAGKAAFVAMGRSAQSRGLPINHQRQMRLAWPEWARQAWAVGWIIQSPINPKSKAKP